MIADTMIPEAVEDTHLAIGIITVPGFLTAFALSASEHRAVRPAPYAACSAAAGRRCAYRPAW